MIVVDYYLDCDALSADAKKELKVKSSEKYVQTFSPENSVLVYFSVSNCIIIVNVNVNVNVKQY